MKLKEAGGESATAGTRTGSLTERLEITIAEKSRERFKEKVRELWRSCQSLSSAQMRDRWRA